jgi:hypothetical protein
MRGALGSGFMIIFLFAIIELELPTAWAVKFTSGILGGGSNTVSSAHFHAHSDRASRTISTLSSGVFHTHEHTMFLFDERV